MAYNTVALTGAQPAFNLNASGYMSMDYVVGLDRKPALSGAGFFYFGIDNSRSFAKADIDHQGNHAL